LNELGLALVVLGLGVVALGLVLLDSTPLVILGLSMVSVGMIAAWGCESSSAVLELSAVAWDNVASIIEGVGFVGRAIYVPSTYIGDSTVYALLAPSGDPPRFRLSRGLVVKYGPNEWGLLLRSLGSRAVELCREVGALSSDVEVSLSNCVVRHLALARGVIVGREGDGLSVVVRGDRLGDPYGGTVVRAVLGSGMASVVASVVAESLGRFVVIDGEEESGGSKVIRLRLL